MAAPDSTKWGNTITGSKSTYKGKIGIYTGVTTSNTEVEVTVQVWCWTMYGVDDVNNSYYYNANATSATTLIGAKSIKHTVSSGGGWSTSNQTKLGESTYTYARGTSASTKNYAAKFTGIDNLGANNVMSVTASVTVPALASYKVTYDANGGSGAPSAQTKWYGKSLTLSSTKPTRTGYSFQGWGTSASDTSVDYAAGASYTGNAAITLYAIWKANTYTVKYNANGGTGAPGNQTKTYGVTLKLSTTKPTKPNYNFKGWATSSSAATATYQAGGDYTANAAVTLYAVWELAYVKPRITGLSADRCDSTGVLSDIGTCILVEFDWSSDIIPDSISIEYKLTTETAWNFLVETGIETNSGNVVKIIGNDTIDIDHSYDVRVKVTDVNGSTTRPALVPGINYVIDILAEGKGIAFNKPAELEGVADFNFQIRPVAGMLQPILPVGTDLDTVFTPNTYTGLSIASSNYTNCPVTSGTFTLIVVAAGDEGQVKQCFRTCHKNNPLSYERYYYQGAWGDWYEYGEYKSAITVGLSANVTLGVVNSYTQIPFNTRIGYSGAGLTLDGNYVKVGFGIRRIRISAMIRVNCGTAAGNRHARLCKNSGGSVSYIAWVNSKMDASDQSTLIFPPIVLNVSEGDLLYMVFYTGDAEDVNYAGSSGNGYQTYMTVETL